MSDITTNTTKQQPLAVLFTSLSNTRKDNVNPPFQRYDGQDSFFGGIPPLSEEVGYGVVLGFGVVFSVVTTILVSLGNRYSSNGVNIVTSEYFT